MPYLRTLPGDLIQFNHNNFQTYRDLYNYVIGLNLTNPKDTYFYRLFLIDENGEVLNKNDAYNLRNDSVISVFYTKDETRLPASVELPANLRIGFKPKRSVKKSKKPARKPKKSVKKSKKSKKSVRKAKK